MLHAYTTDFGKILTPKEMTWKNGQKFLIWVPDSIPRVNLSLRYQYNFEPLAIEYRKTKTYHKFQLKENDPNFGEDNKETKINYHLLIKIQYILLLTFDSACLAPDLVFLLALPPEEEADVPEAPPLPPDVADESPWALVAAGLAAAAALLGALGGSGSEARAFSSIVTTLDLEAGWKSRHKIF